MEQRYSGCEVGDGLARGGVASMKQVGDNELMAKNNTAYYLFMF